MLKMSHMLSVLVFLAMGASSVAHAQGFSALVSPPRFEDSVKAGDVYRNVVEVSNVSNTPADFSVSTADWTFRPQDASVDFYPTLQEGSCRPWVYLENNKIKLSANGKKRYRFEVRVPADAPAQECRFAILIAGDAVTTAGAVPVAGRLGVVVYLRVGDARPQLSLEGYKVLPHNDSFAPALVVRNSGNATARLEGYVDGVDAAGNKISFLPTSYPILPGRTDEVILVPQAPNAKSAAPTIQYPVTIKGQVDWEGKRLPVEHVFQRE